MCEKSFGKNNTHASDTGHLVPTPSTSPNAANRNHVINRNMSSSSSPSSNLQSDKFSALLSGVSKGSPSLVIGSTVRSLQFFSDAVRLGLRADFLFVRTGTNDHVQAAIPVLLRDIDASYGTWERLPWSTGSRVFAVDRKNLTLEFLEVVSKQQVSNNKNINLSQSQTVRNRGGGAHLFGGMAGITRCKSPLEEEDSNKQSCKRYGRDVHFLPVTTSAGEQQHYPVSSYGEILTHDNYVNSQHPINQQSSSSFFPFEEEAKGEDESSVVNSDDFQDESEVRRFSSNSRFLHEGAHAAPRTTGTATSNAGPSQNNKARAEKKVLSGPEQRSSCSSVDARLRISAQEVPLALQETRSKNTTDDIVPSPLESREYYYDNEAESEDSFCAEQHDEDRDRLRDDTVWASSSSTASSWCEKTNYTGSVLKGASSVNNESKALPSHASKENFNNISTSSVRRKKSEGGSKEPAIVLVSSSDEGGDESRVQAKHSSSAVVRFDDDGSSGDQHDDENAVEEEGVVEESIAGSVLDDSTGERQCQAAETSSSSPKMKSTLRAPALLQDEKLSSVKSDAFLSESDVGQEAVANDSHANHVLTTSVESPVKATSVRDFRKASSCTTSIANGNSATVKRRMSAASNLVCRPNSVLEGLPLDLLDVIHDVPTRLLRDSSDLGVPVPTLEESSTKNLVLASVELRSLDVLMWQRDCRRFPWDRPSQCLYSDVEAAQGAETSNATTRKITRAPRVSAIPFAALETSGASGNPTKPIDVSWNHAPFHAENPSVTYSHSCHRFHNLFSSEQSPDGEVWHIPSSFWLGDVRRRCSVASNSSCASALGKFRDVAGDVCDSRGAFLILFDGEGLIKVDGRGRVDPGTSCTTSEAEEISQASAEEDRSLSQHAAAHHGFSSREVVGPFSKPCWQNNSGAGGSTGSAKMSVGQGCAASRRATASAMFQGARSSLLAVPGAASRMAHSISTRATTFSGKRLATSKQVSRENLSASHSERTPPPSCSNHDDIDIRTARAAVDITTTRGGWAADTTTSRSARGASKPLRASNSSKIPSPGVLPKRAPGTSKTAPSALMTSSARGARLTKKSDGRDAGSEDLLGNNSSFREEAAVLGEVEAEEDNFENRQVHAANLPQGKKSVQVHRKNGEVHDEEISLRSDKWWRSLRQVAEIPTIEEFQPVKLICMRTYFQTCVIWFPILIAEAYFGYTDVRFIAILGAPVLAHFGMSYARLLMRAVNKQNVFEFDTHDYKRCLYPLAVIIGIAYSVYATIPLGKIRGQTYRVPVVPTTSPGGEEVSSLSGSMSSDAEVPPGGVPVPGTGEGFDIPEGYQLVDIPRDCHLGMFGSCLLIAITTLVYPVIHMRWKHGGPEKRIQKYFMSAGGIAEEDTSTCEQICSVQQRICTTEERAGSEGIETRSAIQEAVQDDDDIPNRRRSEGCVNNIISCKSNNIDGEKLKRHEDDPNNRTGLSFGQWLWCVVVNGITSLWGIVLLLQVGGNWVDANAGPYWGSLYIAGVFGGLEMITVTLYEHFYCKIVYQPRERYRKLFLALMKYDHRVDVQRRRRSRARLRQTLFGSSLQVSKTLNDVGSRSNGNHLLLPAPCRDNATPSCVLGGRDDATTRGIVAAAGTSQRSVNFSMGLAPQQRGGPDRSTHVGVITPSFQLNGDSRKSRPLLGLKSLGVASTAFRRFHPGPLHNSSTTGTLSLQVGSLARKKGERPDFLKNSKREKQFDPEGMQEIKNILKAGEKGVNLIAASTPLRRSVGIQRILCRQKAGRYRLLAAYAFRLERRLVHGEQKTSMLMIFGCVHSWCEAGRMVSVMSKGIRADENDTSYIFSVLLTFLANVPMRLGLTRCFCALFCDAVAPHSWVSSLSKKMFVPSCFSRMHDDVKFACGWTRFFVCFSFLLGRGLATQNWDYLDPKIYHADSVDERRYDCFCWNKHALHAILLMCILECVEDSLVYLLARSNFVRNLPAVAFGEPKDGTASEMAGGTRAKGKNKIRRSSKIQIERSVEDLSGTGSQSKDIHERKPSSKKTTATFLGQVVPSVTNIFDGVSSSMKKEQHQGLAKTKSSAIDGGVNEKSKTSGRGHDKTSRTGDIDDVDDLLMSSDEEGEDARDDYHPLRIFQAFTASVQATASCRGGPGAASNSTTTASWTSAAANGTITSNADVLSLARAPNFRNGQLYALSVIDFGVIFASTTAFVIISFTITIGKSSFLGRGPVSDEFWENTLDMFAWFTPT